MMMGQAKAKREGAPEDLRLMPKSAREAITKDPTDQEVGGVWGSWRIRVRGGSCRENQRRAGGGPAVLGIKEYFGMLVYIISLR